MNAPYNPHNRRLVFAGSPQQLDAFLQNQPRVLPPAPVAKPADFSEFPMHWRLVAALLACFCFVLLLVAFLILGEWPRRTPPVVPPHLQHLKK